MNHNFILLSTVAFIFFLSSCSSTYQNSSSLKTSDDGYSNVDKDNSLLTGTEVRPNDERKSNMTLGDMILQNPGIEASGNGNNMQFKVRGAQSIFGDTNPLFVLNGQQVGTDYSSIVNLINPNDVKSIRVLKGPDASIYGTRGANGVIVIKTN